VNCDSNSDILAEKNEQNIVHVLQNRHFFAENGQKSTRTATCLGEFSPIG
jgi:hypothetical protein